MAKKSSKTPLIAGGIAGGCLLLCICGGIIGFFVVGASDGGGGSSVSSDVSTSISAMNLLMEGGSGEWDTAVQALMLEGFDSNNSGAINTAGEVALVDCATWKALDTGVKEKYEYGLRSIYGFEEGYSWVGYAIGFDESIRVAADASLAACLSGAPAPAAAAAPAAAGGGAVATQIAALPNPASSEWDESVKKIVVAAYDANGSGMLNTADEISAVPCDAWKAMDDGVKATYGFGIRTIYGFEEGYSRVGSAVGFDEGLRAKADKALVGCGLTGS